MFTIKTEFHGNFTAAVQDKYDVKLREGKENTS